MKFAKNYKRNIQISKESKLKSETSNPSKESMLTVKTKLEKWKDNYKMKPTKPEMLLGKWKP